MQKPLQRIAGALLGLGGIVACSLMLRSFMVRLWENRLPWGAGSTTRDHYLAVGDAYGDGFTTGFFACLSLMLLGSSIVAWIAQRRALTSSISTRPGPFSM